MGHSQADADRMRQGSDSSEAALHAAKEGLDDDFASAVDVLGRYSSSLEQLVKLLGLQ